MAGIPLFHPGWLTRRREIARALRGSPYGLVAVQEVWRDKDARLLAEQSGYPHWARYQRNIELGTGLLLLSRWPILERRQGRFSLRPSLMRLPQGESVANKGALMARVDTPWGALDVWTAHLISDYPEARYRSLRLTQLYELSEMILSASQGRPTVVLGDFNMKPGDPEYSLFADLLGLQNACELGPAGSCGPTSDSGRQIDHVFVPRGAPRGLAAVRAVFADRDWSDHLAVEASLGPALMGLRLGPAREARAEALASVEGNLSAMIEQMVTRLRLRQWLPVYGLLMRLRYDHQLGQLREIRARADTARLRTLGPPGSSGKP